MPPYSAIIFNEDHTTSFESYLFFCYTSNLASKVMALPDSREVIGIDKGEEKAYAYLMKR
jgi:hypothetical protein